MTVRAMVIEEFGGPEVLKAAEVPVPQPGPGEVAIDVAYAGVNFSDLLARSAGYRVDRLPHVPGAEIAGRIRAVGSGVTGFVPGQQVAAYMPGGGYAEAAVAPAATVLPLPAGVSLRAGASLLVVLPTAYALLHEIARLRKGDSVLVHSAAGGVGTVAGQLARCGGAAAIYGVVSNLDKADHVLKYGYDRVFAAATFDADVRHATAGRGVDIALDPLGGDPFRRTLALVTRFGRLVSFGNATGSGQPWQVGPAETYALGVSIGGFSLPRLATDPAQLRRITDLAFRALVDHELDLPVTAEFDLEDASQAHQLMESRMSTGKLLLRMAPAY